MHRLAILLAMPLALALPQPVAAADLGSPRQPYAAPAPIWSGMYLGAHVGHAAGDDEAREINGPRTYIADQQSAIGGVHIGWQKQHRNWVVGLEIEAGYLGLGGDIERNVTGGFVTSGADLGAYASFSGRIGVLSTPTWLIYARAGVVAAQIDARTRQTCTGIDLCGGAQSTPVSNADSTGIAWGLLLGAGVERQLSANWTGRLEYQLMDFRDALALPPIDGPGWKHDVDVHAVKLGLSYRF